MTTQKTPRSDGLLPADDEVAEEVNLDQQSDQARRVGKPPVIPDKAPAQQRPAEP
ncbi:hypothetical protein [Duganella sp. P38]|jgi:hypothetical protein|uniref:hypothetical protein n=1 Tax=Duganella sp. P38 TaxID=3423949 RepID=UPI003D7ADE99